MRGRRGEGEKGRRGEGVARTSSLPGFSGSSIGNLSVLILTIFILTFFAGSCRRGVESGDGDRKIRVVATLFPLYDFAKNIGGDRVHVTLLLPPGVEPHSFDPLPGDMMKVQRAGLFVYTGRFMEPWVEDILKGVDRKNLLVVDSSKGIALIEGAGKAEDHKHGEHDGRADPHIWLDLSNAARMVDNILAGLVQKDAGNAEYYRKNANAFKAKLNDLDAGYRTTLSTCKNRAFIHGGHFAFSYLARRYNLRYISAYHGSPDAEPTPKRLIELKNKVKELNLHYIYYEELITPRVAGIISEETGAALLKLHGAHNVTREEMEKGITFLSIMEDNLKNLKVGLECP